MRSRNKNRWSNTSRNNFNLQRPVQNERFISDEDGSKDKMTPASSRLSTSTRSSPSAKDTFESPSTPQQRKRFHLDKDNLSLLPVSDNSRLLTPRVLIETDDIIPDSMQSYIRGNKKTSGYSETIENRFNNVIDTITSLKGQQSALREMDQKEKKIEPFFKGSVKQLSYKLFHNHKTVSDEEIKEMLKGF
ncbi:682_t:CDS:2 [Funneliformis geosporum]|nr:682_t:CDS:2 [Funneliformis geosporum]